MKRKQKIPKKLEGLFKGFSKKQILNNIKANMNPTNTWVIKMHLRNSTTDEFAKIVKHNKFKYDGEQYIIDESCAEYSVLHGQFTLEYIEGCSLPIGYDRKKLLDKRSKKPVDLVVDSMVLDNFMRSDIIKKILTGTDDQTMQMLKMASLGSFVISLLTLIAVIWTNTGTP